MAYELKTIFTVKDNASSAFRNMLRQVQNLDKAINKLVSQTNQLGSHLNHNNSTINNSTRIIVRNTTVISNNSNTINQHSNTVNNNTNTINRNAGARNTLIGAIGRESSALRGLGASLVSVAGLYAAAHGASKAFQATIGAAAQYQQSEVAVKAIFNDDGASKAYLNMVDSMAIDSPLLNSGEMLKSSKTLVAMTKNVGDLGKAWSIIERLMVLDPTQGTDGAAFALKEMWQGDAISMVERFGLNKKELNVIKKMSIPKQIAALNKMLDKMGITQKTVNAMGATTLGYWAQIQERVEKFGRVLGASGNTKLGEVLGNIVAQMDNMDMDGMAKRFGDALGNIVEKAINVGKFLWKWREPILWITGAITAAVTAFVGIGIIAALANPVSLIAAGIAGAAVGMYALYTNSETFRGAIEGIVGKAKELWAAFKNDGVSGVITELFPPSIASTIQGVITQVKSLWSAFKTGGVSGLLEALLPEGMLAALQARFATIKDQFTNTFTAVYNAVVPILQTAWTLVSPILSALGTALKIVADIAMLAWNNILAPAIQFVAAAIQTMWKIAGPIFELLGAVIQTAFSVLKIVWDTIVGPFVAFLAGAFTTGFGMATEVVKALSPVFEKLGGMIRTAADYLKTFADWLGKVKVPDWIGKIGGSAVNFAKKLVPGHYHGLTNVPYDNYVASLHKGEMVLTRQEADAYRNSVGNVSYERATGSVTNNTYNTYGSSNAGSTQSGGGISITGNQFTVREESDIKKVALELAKLIEEEATFVVQK